MVKEWLHSIEHVGKFACLQPLMQVASACGAHKHCTFALSSRFAECGSVTKGSFCFIFVCARYVRSHPSNGYWLRIVHIACAIHSAARGAPCTIIEMFAMYCCCCCCCCFCACFAPNVYSTSLFCCGHMVSCDCFPFSAVLVL